MDSNRKFIEAIHRSPNAYEIIGFLVHECCISHIRIGRNSTIIPVTDVKRASHCKHTQNESVVFNLMSQLSKELRNNKDFPFKSSGMHINLRKLLKNRSKFLFQKDPKDLVSMLSRKVSQEPTLENKESGISITRQTWLNSDREVMTLNKGDHPVLELIFNGSKVEKIINHEEVDICDFDMFLSTFMIKG